MIIPARIAISCQLDRGQVTGSFVGLMRSISSEHPMAVNPYQIHLVLTIDQRIMRRVYRKGSGSEALAPNEHLLTATYDRRTVIIQHILNESAYPQSMPVFRVGLQSTVMGRFWST